MAKIGGLELAYFSRYFHSKVGISFSRWLNALRIGKAIELLANTDLTITEISQQTGFNDLRTFERAFKKVAGTPPREYRNGQASPGKTNSAA
jgi:AraC-like DNA-binding protein